MALQASISLSLPTPSTKRERRPIRVPQSEQLRSAAVLGTRSERWRRRYAIAMQRRQVKAIDCDYREDRATGAPQPTTCVAHVLSNLVPYGRVGELSTNNP
jgi:hypothetical protein